MSWETITETDFECRICTEEQLLQYRNTKPDKRVNSIFFLLCTWIMDDFWLDHDLFPKVKECFS